jgi:hypothetical protein
MTDDTSAPVPRRNITPSQLPLREQAALFERLQRARGLRPPKSWQQLAAEKGFRKRTLEHFYNGARELEENADKRPHLEIADERERRFIHAQATATPPSRTLIPLSDVPDDLVFPPLRREITPSQLPLREQAALFAELQEARRRRPAPSWRYLAIAQGFAKRTLEHFHRSAMKLERNADRRPVAQIFVERLRARSSAMPVGRRSSWGRGEVGVGESRAVERRRARTEAGRRARKTSAAETERSAALLDDERRAAEAHEVERQQRRAQEDLARVEDAVRQAEGERDRDAEEEQLRERDLLQQLMGVWDPFWGPRPLDEPF